MALLNGISASVSPASTLGSLGDGHQWPAEAARQHPGKQHRPGGDETAGKPDCTLCIRDRCQRLAARLSDPTVQPSCVTAERARTGIAAVELVMSLAPQLHRRSPRQPGTDGQMGTGRRAIRMVDDPVVMIEDVDEGACVSLAFAADCADDVLRPWQYRSPSWPA